MLKLKIKDFICVDGTVKHKAWYKTGFFKWESLTWNMLGGMGSSDVFETMEHLMKEAKDTKIWIEKAKAKKRNELKSTRFITV